MAQIQSLVPFTIPAPVGGLNARDPIMDMPSEDATELKEVVCRNRTVAKRQGYETYIGASASSTSVGNLMTMQTDSGVQKLLAVFDDPATTAGAQIFDISTPAYTNITNPAAISPDVFPCSYVHFGGRLIFCNSANSSSPPYYYTGSGSVTPCSFTGMNPYLIRQVTSYRNRLYFTLNASSAVWYGGVNAVAGALTIFDLGSLLQRGGYLMYAASTTQRTGVLSDEMIAFVSSEGEVLLYVGASPEDDGWTQVGRYFVGKPLGRLSYFYAGAELYLITDQGVVPFSAIVGGQAQNGKYASLSDKIDDLLRVDANFYKSASPTYYNWGWSGIWHQADNKVVLNIVSEAPPVPAFAKQYVANPQTQAWSSWSIPQATSWAVFNDELYFGTRDGGVCKMTGYNDDGAAVVINIKQAPTACGNPIQNKRFHLAKTYATANSQPAMTVAVDTDFGSQSLVQTAWAGTGSAVENNYATTHGLSGIGLYGALRITSSISDTAFELAGTTLFYEKAGIS